jgi:bifunctional non-homologous end joining protein LigD
MAKTEVMLAKSAEWSLATVDRLSDGWLWEPKLDGMRCLLRVSGNEAELTSRAGNSITHKFPDVAAAAIRDLGGNEIVLDGEIVGLDATGSISFPVVAKRNAQSAAPKIQALIQSHPVAFMAFDLLSINGVDAKSVSLLQRRGLLEETAGNRFTEIALTPQSSDGATVMREAHALGLEGVMAKAAASKYCAGRSTSWLKMKPTHSATLIVTGTTPGQGSRSDTFGAVVLSAWDGTQLVEVGEAGSGFTQDDLVDMVGRLSSGQVTLVEVQYQEVTKDGRLRFPVFKGVRDDVAFIDCSISQLDRPFGDVQ